MKKILNAIRRFLTTPADSVTVGARIITKLQVVYATKSWTELQTLLRMMDDARVHYSNESWFEVMEEALPDVVDFIIERQLDSIHKKYFEGAHDTNSYKQGINELYNLKARADSVGKFLSLSVFQKIVEEIRTARLLK